MTIWGTWHIFRTNTWSLPFKKNCAYVPFSLEKWASWQSRCMSKNILCERSLRRWIYGSSPHAIPCLSLSLTAVKTLALWENSRVSSGILKKDYTIFWNTGFPLGCWTAWLQIWRKNWSLSRRGTVPDVVEQHYPQNPCVRHVVAITKLEMRAITVCLIQ